MFLEGEDEIPLSISSNNTVTTTEVGFFDKNERKVVTGTFFTLDDLTICAGCPLDAICLRKGQLPSGATVRRVDMSQAEAEKQGANCQN